MAYDYSDTLAGHHHKYLWPAVSAAIKDLPRGRAFDLGCGNGWICAQLSASGFDTVGVDPSPTGVEQARGLGLVVHVGDAYSDLVAVYGQFPLVVSLEVIEHCYDPRAFVRTFMSLVAPGGTGILSTPYHGYLKNLALALSGKMDAHFTALWHGGHIKFFSIPTLRALLEEAGARHVRFVRVGRIPPLAMSMVAIVKG